MFENITNKFQSITNSIFSSGQLTEKKIEEGLREVRKALLEADVNFKVVKSFVGRVKEKAIGQNIIKDVRPGDQFIKIVADELVALMGPVDTSIEMAKNPPTVIMMAGLQGSGKTTTCGKLTNRLLKDGHRPLLVAADLQRPAAIEQLKVIGETLGVPVFTEPKWSPPKVCEKSIAYAKKHNCDVVILDTAGRLHIDDELMEELLDIKKQTKPHHTFLVTDAMTGQDAVESAGNFNQLLKLDGVILTKLDGDARGGAALSIKEVTGCTIKFAGVGEKLDRLEEFNPEQMADRILGKGDVVELVRRAETIMDEETAAKMQQKLLDASFTFQDFLEQISMVKKMGSMTELLGMLPSNMLPGGMMGQIQNSGMDMDKMVDHTKAMICSMTPDERNHPDMIDGSRRNRIAKGSGRSIQDVNQLLKQFREMRKMMQNMGKMGGLMKGMAGMMGDGDPSAMPSMASMAGMGGMMRPGKNRSRRKKKPRRKK